MLGCAWTLHANVFGASVYPQLSSANFDSPVTMRPPFAVKSAPSAADTIAAALAEPAPVISAQASVPPLLSFDDRFAAAAPESVEPAAPAEAPKLVEAPKLNSPETVDRADSSDEPFGLSTATVTQGAVLEKWLSIKREVSW